LETPPLVRQALALAEPQLLPEAGALLHVLAAGPGIRRAAQIGGGPVEAAWLLSALAPETLFVTTEAGNVPAGDEHARAVARAELADEAPFDLLALHEEAGEEEVLGLLAPRGLVVASPPQTWLEEHPELVAVDLARAVVAARR
jgi:hypothetical protein